MEQALDQMATKPLTTDQTLLERIQELPEELRRDNLDYRAEAERMMRSKRFGASDRSPVCIPAIAFGSCSVSATSSRENQSAILTGASVNRSAGLSVGGAGRLFI